MHKVIEIELRKLTITVKNLHKEVGGISNTVGYELEDKLYPLLPQVLIKDFGIRIEGELERKFIEYPDGGDDEINIYGKGYQNGETVYIIGESKAQIGKKDIEIFVKMLNRLKNALKGEIIPFMICYMVHPRIERYISENYPHIKIYKSYEVKRGAKSN